MCDVGRADYRWMNRGDRVETPMVAGATAGGPASWDDALAHLAMLVTEASGPVVVLLGTRASCETIGWTLRLTGPETVAAMQVPVGDEAPLVGVPNLALRRERAANLHGAQLLGVDAPWERAVSAMAGAALVVIVDAELTDAEAAATAGAERVVHLTTVADPRLQHVALLLPICNVTEEQGVLVNRDGRAQRYLPVRTPPGMARPGWWVAANAWARRDATRSAPATAAEAFAALSAMGGLGYGDLGLTGRIIPGVGAGARE